MVSVSHTVVVEPVPYEWLVDALGVVRALVEESRAEGQRLVLPDGQTVPDVRLTRGRHLRPGAVYLVPDENGEGEGKGTGAGETARITVREWDRRRAVRLELAVAEDDGTVELDAALKSPDRPRLIEVGGRARTEGAPLGLSHLKGRARVRLDDWWTAADTERTMSSAPASARLDHRWLRADVRATPRPRWDDDRWDVRVTVSVRGRSFLRPLAALVLAAAGRGIHRTVARTLDDTAERWNEAVPRLVAMDSGQWREALLTGARHLGSDDDGA
ncbi:hypothetical protein [Streptomyces sp. NTH33]|uniref:hypothetical protein n=1 Tax=Streptomyces sp. NTH33 TaxID=1735453 RepID=UPI0015E8EB17|nr:hypothetical protein [Streptomyces sp. NTH33]